MPFADPEQQKQYLRDYRKRKRAENPEVARYDARERKRRQRPESTRTGPTKSVSAKQHLPTSDEHVAWTVETAGWGHAFGYQRVGQDRVPLGPGDATFEYVEESYMEEVYEPILPPSSLEDLVARPGMKWLLRLTAEERAVVWKVVTLGRSATENRFSLTENAILRKLAASHRIAATPADDVELRSWDWDKNRRRLVPRNVWRYQLCSPIPDDYDDEDPVREDYDDEDDPEPPTITQGGHR